MYRTLSTFLNDLFNFNNPSTDSFYKGYSKTGQPPGLWTLTLSQVTTWIFARSLMNAAILGYFYGIAGALAYTAYYLSFISGAHIIDSLRFKHGYDNIPSFMRAKFGKTGEGFFNGVVFIRLLSEVFANLLVVALIFGVAGSNHYTIAIVVAAVFTFLYSASGGLHNSIRTDVIQALLIFVALIVIAIAMFTHSDFSLPAIISSSPNIDNPGWVLLLVAFLQVLSYPMHDPVMTDRGFIADRSTTKKSFYYAAVISIVCIMLFGLLGSFSGLLKGGEEGMIDTLSRLFSQPVMWIFNFALVVSAISTLDSTFSSASKLVASDMKLVKPTANNGRLVMALFLAGGLVFIFIGSKDLFDAVAVSGTASMFLIPVILFSLWGKQEIHRWALVLTFIVTIAGSAIYMLESSKHISLIGPMFDITHKYSILLVICLCILLTGLTSFALARKR